MRFVFRLTTLFLLMIQLIAPQWSLAASKQGQAGEWLKNVPDSTIKRVKEERFVLVRVIDQPIDLKVADGQRKVQIDGLMRANASHTKSFEYIKKFENLKKISSVIKTADFDPKTNQLLFVCEAFNYRATMKIDVKFEESTSKTMRFKVVDGTMKGYEGTIAVRSEPKFQSTVEFNSHFDYLTLPIPRLFVEFGFGIIFQKIAERLRSGIESQKRDQH